MASINTSQNSDLSIRTQAAKDYWYKIAQRWHFLQVSVATALALGAPLALWFAPSWGPALGAIAGAWIFIGRILVKPLESKYQLKGVAAHESFDVNIFGLLWNDGLAKKPSDEEIHSADRSYDASARAAKFADWYAVDESVQWPLSVLLCQRSNAVWARRQHSAYGTTLAVAAAAWVVAGILVSAADGASLASYLATIALPSLPGLLDAVESSQAHFDASKKRLALEAECDNLIESTSATVETLREIQDRLFGYRRDSPLVAQWFYKLLRRRYGQDMSYAVERISNRTSSQQP